MRCVLECRAWNQLMLRRRRHSRISSANFNVGHFNLGSQANVSRALPIPQSKTSRWQLVASSYHSPHGSMDYNLPTDAVTCTDAQVCLELQISSAYRADPFFLHRYDANTPLVSATFDAFDAGDILPLVPGSADTDGEATTWWFQSNATTADTSTGTTTGTASTAPHPAIDLLLRLRQRSQRLSARDQLLVNVHVELVDTRTTTSAIKVYSIYGNQRLTHTTHRVDAKTIQVALSISRNENKRDVCLIDAYPQIDATTATDASSASGSSCTACGDFLDSCQDIEPCQTIVLPCLLSQFEQMTSGEGRSGSSSSPDSDAQSDSDSQSANAGDAGSDASGEMEAGAAADPDLSAWYDAFFTDIVNSSRLLADFETVGEEDSTAATSIDPSNGGIDGSSGSTGSGSAGSSQGGVDGTTQVDLLRPLATCLASLPAAVWPPIRQAIFCLAQSNCALGTVQGKDAGQESPTVLRLTNGTQKFVLTPIAAGTDNVDLTIVSRSIDSASSADGEQKFEYSASASYLGMFLRSFVLLRAADVSVLVEPYATDPSVLQVTLTYSDALMFRSVEFFSTAGQVGMLEDLPARAMLEYPVSSSRPALDIILRELRARVNSDDDSTGTSHSWILAQDCLTCSAQLFGCSSTAVASKSCNYNTMSSPFGQCLRKQFPRTLFKGMMQGIASSRPVATEMSRCVTAAATATTTAASPTTSPSSAMLAASSSLACFASTRCPFGPIALVQDARAIVLETTSYIQILRISSSSSSSTTSIKVMYKAGDQFTASTAPIYATMPENQIEQVIKEALVSTGIDVSVSSSGGELLPSEWTLEIIYRYVFLPGKFSVNAVVDGTSATISQFVMEGGAAQLRAVPRDRSKIFKQSEVNAGSTTGSKDLGSGDEGTSSSSTSGGSASSATSSSSTSGGSSSSDTSASSSHVLEACERRGEFRWHGVGTSTTDDGDEMLGSSGTDSDALDTSEKPAATAADVLSWLEEFD
ncbi:unnamed protein product [Phytophthora lilii]|uniref:Unnamed protein product n=1 Tax=Phytophthora lilii TaxID=2077276 RepID=A0A9W6WJ41_9STRA|nr:unnamed protein product [Phytophthora lilii]